MSKIKQSLAFKTHLDMLSSEEANALLHFMSEEEMSKVREMPSYQTDTINAIPPYSYLAKIHPSWLCTIFDTLSPKDIQLVLAAFVNRRDKIGMMLGIQVEPITLTPAAKMYILSWLYKKFFGKSTWIPFPYLAGEPFFEIFSLDYKNVRDLIDLLGLHDVSLELNTMIQAEQLRGVHRCLSKEKVDYLKRLKGTKELISYGKLHLASWNGDSEKFHKILFERGLHRLAKALGDSSSAYISHLLYLFSRDDARLFKTFYAKKKNPNVIEVLRNELKSALDYLKSVI